MPQRQARLAKILAYAGIIPPWLCLAVSLVTYSALAQFAALTYGAVIASFVCGAHWGLVMKPGTKIPFNLLMTSNAGALTAWLILVASLWSAPLAFVGLVGVLAILLLIDHRLLAAESIEPWFWVVRRNASIGLGSAMIAWSMMA